MASKKLERHAERFASTGEAGPRYRELADLLGADPAREALVARVRSGGQAYVAVVGPGPLGPLLGREPDPGDLGEAEWRALERRHLIGMLGVVAGRRPCHLERHHGAGGGLPIGPDGLETRDEEG